MYASKALFESLHLILLEYGIPFGFFFIGVTNPLSLRLNNKLLTNSSSLAISLAISAVKLAFGKIL